MLKPFLGEPLQRFSVQKGNLVMLDSVNARKIGNNGKKLQDFKERSNGLIHMQGNKCSKIHSS